MACFIVESGVEPERVAELRRLAAATGLAAQLRRDLGAVAADPAFHAPGRSLVLVPATAGSRLPAEVLAFAEGAGAAAHTIYVADTIDPEIYKRLVRTGAADWANWAALPGELADAAARIAAAGPAGGSAKIVSFVPSKGGVGATTLALETGVHLATRRKRGGARVAIVDLDLRGGPLADMLDVEPRFDIREIGGRPDRLDEHLVDVLTSRHASGLDVFASPIRRVDPAEIDPQVVFAFLDAIAGRYDVILIDAPHRGLPWIDTLVQGSDVVVAIGGSTVPALKQLAALLAHLRAIAVPADALAAAIGPCDTDLIGRVARRHEIDKALPECRRFFVRRDGAAVGAAHDAGRPVMESSPGGRVGRDVRALAEWIAGLTAGVAAPGARRSRP